MMLLLVCAAIHGVCRCGANPGVDELREQGRASEGAIESLNHEKQGLLGRAEVLLRRNGEVCRTLAGLKRRRDAEAGGQRGAAAEPGLEDEGALGAECDEAAARYHEGLERLRRLRRRIRRIEEEVLQLGAEVNEVAR